MAEIKILSAREILRNKQMNEYSKIYYAKHKLLHVKDYQNSKIYVIKNVLTDKIVYVGQTIFSIEDRMRHHRNDSNCNNVKKQKMKIYKAFKDIGFENFKIELYENYPCENKQALLKREGEVIRLLDTVVNGYNTYTNDKSSNESHEYKEKLNEYSKQYNKIHQERLYEYNKQYKIEHPEVHKSSIKKYYEKNKEKLNEYTKEYLKANSDKINAKHREKIECPECQAIISRGAMYLHKKNKHKINLKI